MNSERIAIKTSGGIEFLDRKDILCCIAKGRYTKVITTSGKEYFLTRLLKDIEDCLSCDDFFRTHKSYLINLNHITNYFHSHDRPITLVNDMKVQLAKRRKQEFQKRLYELVRKI